MSTEFSFKVSALRWLALVLVSLCSGAHAVSSQFDILLDLDGNPATGCSVNTPGGVFPGVERILSTYVETDGLDQANVVGVEVRRCQPGSNSFSAPELVSAGGWPVGIGNGVDGFNVVETFLPVAPELRSSTLIIGVVAQDELGNTSVLFQSSPGSGNPITLGGLPSIPIPFASSLVLGLLALVLLVAGLLVLSRRGRMSLTAMVCLVGAGVAGAACVLDGQIFEWTAEDQLAEGAATDPTQGVGLRALFGKRSDGDTQLCFRIDTALVFSNAPQAQDDAYSTVLTAVLNVAAGDGLLSNDNLGLPESGVVGFGAGDLGGNVTDNAPGSTVVFGADGSVSVNADGSFTFQAASGFEGSFNFFYRLENLSGSSDASVTIAVQSPPVAVDDALKAVLGQTLLVAAPGVLDNDNGMPAPSVVSFGGGDLGGSVTDHAAGSVLAIAPDGSVTVNADGSVSFTAPSGVGATFEFQYRVENVVGHSQASIVISVNDAPGITSADNVTCEVGQVCEFQFTAQGSPTPVISLDGALPPGVSFNAALERLEGVPEPGSGASWPLVITASNGNLPDAVQAFTLSVNEAPSITSADAFGCEIGEPCDFTFTASGFPAPEFTLPGLPAGLSLDPVSGVLSGVAAPGTGAVYALTLSATNGIAPNDDQGFTLTIGEAPSITSAPSLTCEVGQACAFTFTADGFPDPSFTLPGLPAGLVLDGVSGALSGTPDVGTGAEYALTLTAANGIAPDDDQTFTLSINEAPTITSADSLGCEVGAPCNFTFTASGFPAPTFALPGLPAGLNLDPVTGVLSGTADDGTGAVYNLTLTAANGIAPADDQGFTLTIGEAPTITSIATLTCEVGQACAFTFTADGFPDPTFSLPGLPAGLTLDGVSGELSGTPDVGTGAEYALTLTAANGIAPDDDQAFALSINEAPTITSADTLGCEVGAPCNFTFTASGFPAPTFALPGLPAGLNLDSVTGVLSGTADDGTGAVYNLTLTAANGIAPADDQGFTLTIGEAPSITSAPSLSCEVGQACAFTFTADGFPDPSFTLPGLPAGLVLDGVSGALSGTPDVGTGAEYALTLTAANGIAPDDDQAFTLSINEAPTITSADTLGCEVGEPCNFTFTADGFPAPTFALPGLPAGLNLDPVTGVLSGAADAGTGAVYNLTLTAANGIAPDDDQGFTLTIGEAPSITSAPSLTCEVGQACAFTFTADGFPDPSFTLPGLPAGLVLDGVSGALSGTPDVGTGAEYALTLTAANGIAPDDDQAFTLTINEAPTITSADTLGCEVGAPCNFTFTASGFPAPTFALPGLPAGLNLDPVTGVLSGAADAGTGAVYNLTLTAANGIAPDDDQAFTLTIGEAPTITSIATLTCEVGQACAFTFTADGFPDPSFTLPGLPAGLVLDGVSGALSGTPDVGTGAEYALTLTAANGIAPDDDQAFALTINEAPTVTSADTLGCEVGAPCNFTFTASGFPAPTFALPGLPAGLNLDPVTGVLSGAADAGTGAVYNLTLTAANGIAPDDDQGFTLTIGEAPTITSAASLSCEVGQACAFTFTADGFPAPGFTLPGLPAGLTLDGVSGALSGTPDAGTGAEYALTLTAANGIAPDDDQAFTLSINEAPTITSADTLGCEVGEPCNFTFTADGFPAPTFALPGLPAGLSLDPVTGVLSGTADDGTGAIYNLTLTAANGIAPDDDQGFTLTIGEAPTITSIATLTCEVGQACAFTFTADGFPDPTFSLPGLPAGLTLDGVSGELSGTPDVGTGAEYALTLTAANGIAPDDDQAFTLSINEAPTIISADTLGCEVGEPCNFTFTADGFPAPTFALPGLPAGLTLDPVTGVLSGTADDGTGAIYNLTLTAANGIAPDDDQAFTLTIGEAPSITSAASLTCEVGQACAFTFTADGFPDPSFTLPGLPAGLTLDGVSGALSGTPDAGTGAEYALTLTAANGIAPDDDQAFTLSINEAPTITSADTLGCEVGEPCNFTFTADGFPAPTFALPGLPAGLSLDPVTGVLSGTADDGTGAVYNLTLTAANGIAPDDDQAFTLTIGEAPTITSAASLTCEVGQACAFTFTADGFPAPGFTLPGLPAGLSLDAISGQLSGTPDAGTGAEYNLTLTAANGIAPDDDQTFTLTINEAPTITSVDTLDCEILQPCNFTFTANGFPAPTFAVPGLPAGLSLDPVTGVLSGAADAGTGAIYNLTLTVANGIAPDDDQAFTLTIGEAPTITSAASLTCEVGQACSFTFTADGFPDPSFTLPGLPAGLVLDGVSGALSGTPDAGTGAEYNLTLTAANGIAPDDDQTFTLTINEAPTITSVDTLDCEILQPCNFTFTATGFPAPSFSLPGLPTGVSLDALSGVLSGTPDAMAGGVYNLTLTVTNGVNPDDVQSFTLNVGSPPEITSADNTQCTVSSVCAFTFTADGVPAPSISVVGALPTGVSFNAGTNALEGTPGAGTGGIYPLSIEASNGFLPDDAQSFTLTVVELPAPLDDPSGGIPGNSSPGSTPYHGSFNAPLVVSAGNGVLGNDSLGFPAASISTPTPAASNGSVALSLDGSFTYTPNAGFTGLDSFEYCLTNTAGSACATVTVAIGIRPAAPGATYPDTLLGNVSIDTEINSMLTVPVAGDNVAVTQQGESNGTAVVRANRTYIFDPNPGHTGAASLIYRVSNGFGFVDGVISFTVGNGIWFVDNAQPAGNGRLSSPFNTLAPAVAEANGWPIFVATGSGNYTGGVSLSAGRTLIGHPSAADLLTITALTAPADSVLPVANPTRPIIINPGGAGLTLGSNNRLYSLQIGNTSGFGIAGTAFGTLTAENLVISGTGGALSLATGSVAGSGFVSVSSSNGANNVSLNAVGGSLNLGSGALSGATGTAFNVVGGAGNISYTGTITAGTGQRPVNIENKTAGTVALTGQVSSTHQGIRLNSNSSATVRFAGGMTLQTGTSIAFLASGGGTVEVCDDNPCNPGAVGPLVNTLQTTTATALSVVNTTIGSNRLEFRSIASNGAASGIILENTGAVGGLSVRGIAAAGSGGSIQNATIGVRLTNAASTDLRNMNIPGSSQIGIRGISVNGLVLNNVSVTNAGTAINHHGIFLTDPAGALDFTNVTATGNFQNNVLINDSNNVGGPVTLTVTGGTYANNNPSLGDSGLAVNVLGTAVWGTSLVTGATFSMNGVVGLFVTANEAGQINDFHVINNTFTGNGTDVGQQIGLDMSKTGTSNMTVRVVDNDFQGHNSQAMNFFSGAGPGQGGNYNARIEDNIVGSGAVFGSGSRIGNCMRIIMQGDSVDRVLVNGNTLRQCPNGRGIEAVGRNGTGGLDITITNNTVNNDFVVTPENGGFSLASIFLQSNCVTTCNTVRADVRGNAVPVTPPNGEVVPGQLGLSRAGATSVLQMVDTTAPISGTCASELDGTNTGSTAVSGVCTLIAGPINTPP